MLVAVVLAGMAGCASPASSAATDASASVPPTQQPRTVAPGIPTSAATPTSAPIVAQANPAPISPTASGELRPVPLSAPAELRTGRFQTPPSLNLPPGYTASLFAGGVTSARFMALGPNGTLFVTGQSGGNVFALTDRNNDGVADEVRVWADGLRQPHGITFHDGYLYVGETSRVVRFGVGTDGERRGGPEVVIPDLPSGGGHNTRTVGFGPDGRLFVAAGSSCNVCNESDERRAAISVYNPDGSGGQVFMRGLRNAVGFVWRPGADELFASNNGRDQLGDDLPFETVYRVRDGGNAGWPTCYPAPDGLRPDPQFGGAGACDAVDPPAVTFQAHTAPLGLRFYDGVMFPEAVRGDLFVALHGSWNRSAPVGYKLIRIPFAGGVAGQAEDFATGWMANEGDRGSVWGRPVDVLVAPDGALLVSDDNAGAIYRITYGGA